MSTSTYLRTRVDARPLAVVLGVGDLVALTAFVVVGTAHHGEQPFSNPDVVAGALVPFVVAWGTLAFVGGLYTSDAVMSVRRALSWTVPVWVFTTLLAHALRSTSAFRGGTTLTFVLVTLVAGGVLVVGWRVLAAVVVEKQRTAAG